MPLCLKAASDYEFTAGSTIHEHFHPEEEEYEVIAGELEMFVDDVAQIVRPGIVAIVLNGQREGSASRSIRHSS